MPPQKPAKTCAMILRVDVEVRNNFKAWCARRNLTMIGALVKHMKKCLRDEKVAEAKAERKRKQSIRYGKKAALRKKYTPRAQACRSAMSFENSASITARPESPTT